jgi:hypothetical protein
MMASVAADMTFELGRGVGEFAVRLLCVHPNATLIETDQSMRRWIDAQRWSGCAGGRCHGAAVDDEQFNVVVAIWMPRHTCPICSVRSGSYAARRLSRQAANHLGYLGLASPHGAAHQL